MIEIGKRSDFERVDKDFYRTIDTRAVDSLQPFLLDIDSPPRYGEHGDYIPGYVHYAEPCFGQGDLARWLKAKGHICDFACDIEYVDSSVYWGNSLLMTEDDVETCDVIITNPPWSRDVLHPMITHFSSLKPTWLLFDADWAHTKQSSSYMKDLCTDIVSVGRLKWIEGTTMSGKDNCAWYRFDVNKERHTRFHGR